MSTTRKKRGPGTHTPEYMKTTDGRPSGDAGVDRRPVILDSAAAGAVRAARRVGSGVRGGPGQARGARRAEARARGPGDREDRPRPEVRRDSARAPWCGAAGARD